MGKRAVWGSTAGARGVPPRSKPDSGLRVPSAQGLLLVCCGPPGPAGSGPGQMARGPFLPASPPRHRCRMRSGSSGHQESLQREKRVIKWRGCLWRGKGWPGGQGLGARACVEVAEVAEGREERWLDTSNKISS